MTKFMPERYELQAATGRLLCIAVSACNLSLPGRYIGSNFYVRPIYYSAEIMIEWLKNRLLKGTDPMEPAVRRIMEWDMKACAVLSLLLENPGITAGQLADRADLEQSTACSILKRLECDGIAERDTPPGGEEWSVNEGAKAAVVACLPRNYQCPGLLRNYK